MATCLYFNLQVLPHDTNDKSFIGEKGYKKLFEILDLRLIEQLKNKELHNSAFPLPRTDYFLVLFTTKFQLRDLSLFVLLYQPLN